jgi:hypothetical protein
MKETNCEHRRRWEDNIKILCRGVNWIYLSHNRVKL